jgi:hypothetical protein
VYDTTGAKVGRLRAYNPQDGYLLVERGWLFPKDLYIPLAAVQGTDAAGDVHLLGLEPVMHFGPGAVCSGHDNRENRTQAVSE